jgi:hypothetical protein
MPSRNFIALALSTLAVLTDARAGGAGMPALVSHEDMTYLGAFHVPIVGGRGFSYGGSGLAFNLAKDSLYIVGNVNDLLTAEISIPPIGGTAVVLQPLAGVAAAKLVALGSGQLRIGGNLVYHGRLYTTGFVYYDASASQTLSHLYRSLDLSASDITGPYRVGKKGAGFYSGYMTAVPPEWRDKLGAPAMTGNCCLSIISRTSYGPSVSAWDPENTGINARILLAYDRDHQTLGSYGESGSHPVFNGTTRITGIFFPAGTASVLFYGSTGVGNYCYGEAAACNDPSNNWKGEHAYPYRAYIWAYDANDLAAVRSGSKRAYEVKPYTTWELSEFGTVGADFATGGAAYDPATGRVYLSQIAGDGALPLVHVYRITSSHTMARQ